LELNIEVKKLKSKVSENDSISTISSKYMNELSLAEKKIDELENKISELIIAVEKGNVATEQLEIFREQLRSKSKENSEFSLMLQSMDLKVKDKEQTKVANKELSRELAEYKVKIGIIIIIIIIIIINYSIIFDYCYLMCIVIIIIHRQSPWITNRDR
jgi:hypothetical protein